MCEGTLPDFHHHGWAQQKIQTNLEFLWDGQDYPAGQYGAWEALRQESSPAVPREPTWPSSAQTSHVIQGATGQDTCLRDLNINHKNKAKEALESKVINSLFHAFIITNVWNLNNYGPQPDWVEGHLGCTVQGEENTSLKYWQAHLNNKNSSFFVVSMENMFWPQH